MPLPKPRSGETEKAFLDRCMGDGNMVSEFEEADQRFAVCKDLWKKGGDEEKAMKNELRYRAAGIRGAEPGKPPGTFSREARSVEAVAATENPVLIWGEEEVLLMKGARFPRERQIPFLDTHARFSVRSVLGSARNLRVEENELRADVVFSRVDEAESALTKVEEGHITDFSVGYRVNRLVRVLEGQSAEIQGRMFTGPVRVVTDWSPKEISLCPIGVDEAAKVRADNQEKEGEKTMNERLRKFLETRGLPATASEDEAWAFLEKLDTRSEGGAPARSIETRQDPAPQDPEQIRLEAVRAEQARILEIRALCDRFNAGELADELIRGNKSVGDAQRAVLDRLGQKPKEPVPGYRPAMELVEDVRDKFRAAAFDGLVLRAGIAVEKPAMGAHELRGFTLRELAREALRIAGQPMDGPVLEMVGRALTTSDFPFILANVANKSLFEGWEGAPETWQTWMGTGQVSDFKEHTLVRAGEFEDLEEVPERGQYKYGGRAEAKEAYKIVTYGKLFAISRQAIINDDLGALTDVPRGHGEAAARKLGDIGYGVLTANAAMGDGVALFHASHGNLGTPAAVAVASIAEGIKLMKQQKDLSGKRRLNIKPVFFLAPVALEGSAMQFFRTQLIGGANNQPNLVNPYQDPYFTQVYEPRLDDADANGWYLAGPKGKTVRMFFLNGMQEPYMEQQQGWTVDGVEYKVRIDAAAKAIDWRGLFFNAGA
jgi:hypothetical protein